MYKQYKETFGIENMETEMEMENARREYETMAQIEDIYNMDLADMAVSHPEYFFENHSHLFDEY